MTELVKNIRDWFEKDKNNRLQIGTIVTSILNFEKFSELNMDPNPNKFNPLISKWAPLDGRSVSGSLLAQYTDDNKVPDARGMFLRGLFSFDSFYNTPIDNSRGTIVNNGPVGTFQDDMIKSHTHGYKAGARKDVSGKGGTSDFAWNAANYTSAAFGGIETRPKSISVFYYVKIN